MNILTNGRSGKRSKLNKIMLETNVIIPTNSLLPKPSIIYDIKPKKIHKDDIIHVQPVNYQETIELYHLIRVPDTVIQIPYRLDDFDINLTFIIPTINRSTLQSTIKSLQSQTLQNWYAIIVFDGMNPDFHCKDPRITFLTCDKLGEGINHAGRVRNYGMTFAKTDWIAFLDDDDSISSNYVETFYEEIKNYKTDVIIFRMHFNNEIFPELKTDNFYKGKVGISFAIKKKIINVGNLFSPSKYEDYDYLTLLDSKKYTIMISPYVLYFVREYNVCCVETGNRVFLNENHNVIEESIDVSMNTVIEEFIDVSMNTVIEESIDVSMNTVIEESIDVSMNTVIDESTDFLLDIIELTVNPNANNQNKHFESNYKNIEYYSDVYYYYKKYRKIKIEDNLKLSIIVIE